MKHIKTANPKKLKKLKRLGIDLEKLPTDVPIEYVEDEVIK